MSDTTLDFSKPHILRHAREYRTAVADIDRLLDRDPARGSEAYERLEFLSVLVADYEDRHDPLDERGTPQSIVDFVLDQRGMTRADFGAAHGRARAGVGVLRRKAATVHSAD